MINVQVTSTLPKITTNPIPDVMQQVADLMEKSILENITEGGRPTAWPLRKSDGAKALQGFAKDISATATDSTATAGVFEPQIKHYAHQNGAHIPALEGKLMVFEIDGITIFTRKRKAFDLPARPFVMFQQSDITAITTLISDAILKGVKGEPVNQ